MFFLNLSAGEFFALLGVLGGTITALYFLDRSKRRKIVSTLQFWVSAGTASQQTSRKKVNQPWSLLLQLLSLALLLLAIAQLQWGTRAAAKRDHVLLLDTSAWSSARIQNGTVLQAELQAAARYVAALPAQDRVLLARADALTTPATTFTSDREQIRAALRETSSSYSALNLRGSLAYAQQAQRWSGGTAGEIVYIGPQRVHSDEANLTVPRNLRVLAVPVNGTNYGIRALDVRRSEADPNAWQAQATLKNYGSVVQSVKLHTQFAGTHFAVRSFNLLPRQEVTAEYNFVTNTGGRLLSELDGDDVLREDNRAALELSGTPNFAVTVYTKRPGVFKPLLDADRRINSTFLDPSQANKKSKADLVILDGVSAAEPFSVSSIWINPVQGGSPIPVKSVVSKASISSWSSSVLAEAGLHARESQIAQAEIFETQPGDSILATTSEGPTIVLRSNGQSAGRKLAVIGFDPLDTHLRYTVTTPLLFANLLDWMAPEGIRTRELRAGRVGSASVTLATGENSSTLKVTAADGTAMPFTVHQQTVQLFTNKPRTAHVSSESGDRILSLTLPDVAETNWTPPSSSVATGIPTFTSIGGSSLDLWQWMACLGGMGLLAEWLLFGRPRSMVRASRRSPPSNHPSKEREPELVAR